MSVDKGLDHRGIWRAIYTSIWYDPDFLKFTRVEKLVFLALRTGPQCNLPCIFRYSVFDLVLITRTKSSSVRLALRALSDAGWIKTEDGIVWIKKGLRFDPNVTLTNPKHLTSIKNTILSLPKKQIVLDFIDYYKIPIAYTIASPIAYPIAYGNQEKEKEKEKEEECEEKPKVKTSFSLSKGKTQKPYYPDAALSEEERRERYDEREEKKKKAFRDLEQLKQKGLA